MRHTIPILLLLIFARDVILASDWPTYKHDITRNGRTDDHLAMPLQLRWSFVSSRPPQLAWPGHGGRTIEHLHLLHRTRFDDVFHPVIANRRVCFGSSVDHHVYCLDAASGEIVWTMATGAPVRVAPTVWNNMVYVGSDDGFAYCVGARDGRLIWKRRAGPQDERILARGRMASRWPVRTSVLVMTASPFLELAHFPMKMFIFTR